MKIIEFFACTEMIENLVRKGFISDKSILTQSLTPKLVYHNVSNKPAPYMMNKILPESDEELNHQDHKLDIFFQKTKSCKYQVFSFRSTANIVLMTKL